MGRGEFEGAFARQPDRRRDDRLAGRHDVGEGDPVRALPEFGFIMRRERAPMADSTDSARAADVPRKASVTSSVDSPSNSSTRAFWVSSGRSSKANSRARTPSRSGVPAASRSCITSSSSGLSSSLRTLATRACPAEVSLVEVSASTLVRSRFSTILAAASGTLAIVTMRLMISPRIGLVSVSSTLAATCGASFDNTMAAVCGCSPARKAPSRAGSSFSSSGQIGGGPSGATSNFLSPMIALISSGESDSLRMVSILSAESSNPAPSVNSASNSATMRSRSLCGIVRSSRAPSIRAFSSSCLKNFSRRLADGLPIATSMAAASARGSRSPASSCHSPPLPPASPANHV